MKNATQPLSTRPYLIRALFEWCNDNAFTPYIAVKVDSNVQVPKEYVQNGEIVLNISLEATSGLQLGNEFVEFKARFGGTPRQIIVPIAQVIAIYARENGQGMAFPAPAASSSTSTDANTRQADSNDTASGESIKTSVSHTAPLTLMSSGTGQGRQNQLDGKSSQTDDQGDGESPTDNNPPPASPSTSRPKLTRIK